jgi:hypothetical protein
MRMAGFITRYPLKPGSTIFVPFGFKRPDPPRARDGPGLVICTGLVGRRK